LSLAEIIDRGLVEMDNKANGSFYTVKVVMLDDEEASFRLVIETDCSYVVSNIVISMPMASDNPGQSLRERLYLTSAHRPSISVPLLSPHRRLGPVITENISSGINLMPQTQR
jgi:hypothetical protein